MEAIWGGKTYQTRQVILDQPNSDNVIFFWYNFFRQHLITMIKFVHRLEVNGHISYWSATSHFHLLLLHWLPSSCFSSLGGKIFSCIYYIDPFISYRDIGRKICRTWIEYIGPIENTWLELQEARWDRHVSWRSIFTVNKLLHVDAKYRS